MTIAGVLAAQAPPGGSVRDLLASNDPARLAWGAELAARSKTQDFVPDLLPLLHSSDERVQEHALDALIRLKARVPQEELAPLLPRFAETIAIIAIENGERDLLLTMVRKAPRFDPLWVALNEALAAYGGADYWAVVLREWTIHVAIYVIDPGAAAVIGRPGGRALCGDEVARDRTGFPPRAVYGLFLSPKPGYTAIVSGPHPVYARRSTSTSGCHSPIDRDDYRADLAATAVRETTPVGGHMRFDVAYRSDATFLSEMSKLREDTLRGFREIVKVLVPDDATLRPHIVVGIEDQRSNKTHGLPAGPPWE